MVHYHFHAFFPFIVYFILCGVIIIAITVIIGDINKGMIFVVPYVEATWVVAFKQGAHRQLCPEEEEEV